MNTMGAAHGPSPTTRPDGTTVWRTHGGSIHRTDGPAIIHPDGSLEWHEHGVRKEPEVEAMLTMLWLARTEDSEASK